MNKERRHPNKDVHYFWEELTLAQKFSVAELQRFGYDLLFVRHLTEGSLAVLTSGEKKAAIDVYGQIDTDPNIHIRH